MNKRIEAHVNKAAKIIEKFPEIEKAVVIGNAMNDSFMIDYDDNIWIAIYTKPGTKISKICCDLNDAFGKHEITGIDLYPMADEDFYVAAHHLIDSGKIIFERN